MRRVLVTGHEGFIGRHLCRELRRRGHEVHGHDLTDGDLTTPDVFANHLAEVQPNQVVHLAAQVGRLFGEDDAIRTINANALMTALVARACGEAGVPVLYSSTSEVYGDQGQEVCHEDSRMLLPHNLYGLSKRWGEEVLRLYAPENLKVVRLSMPYGPGAPPGRGRRAMDNFLWQAYHRKVITVHRGAERSWCHVYDTVRGVCMVMERGEGAYNVGRDDHPVPMLELARWACDIAGAPYSLIDVIDAPARQTVVKRLDTSRLRGLGWEPRVDLDKGMHEVFEWVKQFPAAQHQRVPAL